MEESKVVQFVKAHLQSLPQISKISTNQQIIPSGCEADIIAESTSGKIFYIVECKGSGNHGDIAGGIGQAYQYNYQKQFNKNATNAEVWFACPEDRIKILSMFEIPKGIRIVLVKNNGSIVHYTHRKFSKTSISELQLPGTFYIEGIRLDVIKETIISIKFLSQNITGKINRALIKNEVNKKCPRLSASAHRNTLITLSSLGIIDSNNRLTPEGYRLYGLIESTPSLFFKEMIKIFDPFSINVLNALLLIAKMNKQPIDNITCSNKEICNIITKFYGIEIRYLNNTRRVNTILHILEEIGAIAITKKSKNKLIYCVNKIVL